MEAQVSNIFLSVWNRQKQNATHDSWAGMDNEKSLNCRNSHCCSSSKKPVDVQAEDGEMWGHIFYWIVITCEIFSWSRI